MFWLIANALAFAGTPIGLIWGWAALARDRHEKTKARLAISLVAISAASLSLLIFFVARFLSPSASRVFDHIGLLGAVGGALVSLAGRLRLVIPVFLIAIGTLMLWYGLTLP